MTPATRRLIRLAVAAPVLGSVLAAASMTSAQTSTSAPTTSRPVPNAPAAVARLPNTFDGPATRTTAPAQTPAPSAQAPTTEPTPAERARADKAEAMLTTTVAALRAGTPNYADMSDDVAAKLRRDLTTNATLLQSFGTVQSVAHVGVENGAELFVVGFERQITQWIIAQDAQGKIVALLFRPVPPPTGG